MKMEKNAQTIFLLTYKHSASEWYPLSAHEYSQLAYKIREKRLSGPQALLNMNKAEISSTIEDESMALRIKNLLDLGGTATLYLERILNQGIRLITRTDDLYPAIFKNLLRDNAPPYLCTVGNVDFISGYQNSCIVSANDLSEISGTSIQDKYDGLICLIDSTRYIKQLAEWVKSWKHSIILSSVGLAKLLRHPVIRESIQSGNTLILSTNAVESEEANFHYLHLYLMAFALSAVGSVVHPQQNTKLTQILDKIRAYEYLKPLLLMDDKPDITRGIMAVGFMRKADRQQLSQTDELPDSPNPSIYTIGHSNHEIVKLFELLQSNHIEMLVDIRSVPSSKYSPQFNQQDLKNDLKHIGIDYKYLGSCLGGRPNDKDVLSSEGKIIREYIEQKDWYQRGIRDLIDIAQTGKRLALMCSEEDPAQCHRGYIVSNTLIEKSVRVLHIRANGEAQDLGILDSATDQMEIPL